MNTTLNQLFPLSILVAEDNQINQKLVASILKKLGYDADFAFNGIEVLQKVNEKNFDLIYMDVQMPELDGLEATKKIVEMFPVEKTPIIIAMTANAMLGDKEICMDAGMNDYLSKPILVEKLRTTIEKWGSILYDRRSFNPDVEWFDTETINNLKNLDDGEVLLINRLADIFFEEAPKKFDSLKIALQNKEYEIVRSMAHSIKGMCLNLGLKKLSVYSHSVETECKASFIEGIHQRVYEMDSVFTTTIEKLKSIL